MVLFWFVFCERQLWSFFLFHQCLKEEEREKFSGKVNEDGGETEASFFFPALITVLYQHFPGYRLLSKALIDLCYRGAAGLFCNK